MHLNCASSDAIRGFSSAQAALLFEDEVFGVVSGTLICHHCTIDQTVADASMQRANLIVAKITNAAAEAKADLARVFKNWDGR